MLLASKLFLAAYLRMVFIKMQTQERNAQIENAVVAPATSTEQFDFDRWAIEVRRQLLASLNKRITRHPYGNSN
jgi:hypothetical protein